MRYVALRTKSEVKGGTQMNRHEKAAIIQALYMLWSENGSVWYSYEDNEVGAPVDLNELITKLETEEFQ
jgi:hypothetical protein